MYMVMMILVCLGHIGGVAFGAETVTTPNVVFFLVDDLGYGDLACFGNTTFATPHISALARGGVRLTSHLTQSMCTPSRTSLLTGRYAVRSGMASSIRQSRVLNSAAHPGGLPSWTTTIAEVLNRTHRRALFGKWHLGMREHLPTFHGFEEYWGMPVTNVQPCGVQKADHSDMHDALFVWKQTVHIWAPLGLLLVFLLRLKLGLVAWAVLMLALWFVPASFTLLNPKQCVLFDGVRLVEQPVRLQNLTWRLVARSKRFIETSAQEKTPFFALVSFHKVHTALFTSSAYERRMATPYQDNVYEMDAAVGAIMETLKEQGVLNETLVIFTSDNGPFLEHYPEAGSTGALRGGKGQVWEGGVRVPAIVSWPGRISGGATISAPTSMCDWFPTIADAVRADLPDGLLLDGVSLLPQLLRPERVPEDRVIFHYCGDRVAAVRWGQWKMVLRTPKWEAGSSSCPSVVICGCSDDVSDTHDPPLIFDLTDDPGEKTPLPPSSHLSSIREEMLRQLREHVASVVPVKNQLEMTFRPWLHPCCNFPFCSCMES